jgi:serine protease Do
MVVVALVLACGLGVGVTSYVVGQEHATTVSASVHHPVPDARATNSAKELSHAFRFAADTAAPSVVKIMSHTSGKQVSGMSGGPQMTNPFKGTPFEDMFPDNPMFRGPQMGRTPDRDGVGSGVIIDKSGIVLTNNHVVQGADELTVQLSDGREFKASDVKTDPFTDLAVLHIKGASDLPVAKLGNSDDLEIGDWVLAIGCPFELEHTVTAGIISSKGRELNDVSQAKYLQTDAAINPGNSGGPLVNIDGEVVGINTAIATNSGGYQGIGFSIPINTAKLVTQQLIHNGHVQRGYLGVQLEEIGPDLASKLGVKPNTGVLVADVMPNTPAAAAGVKEGDIIRSFNGKTVHGASDLRDLVEAASVGSKQSLEVSRNGKAMTLSVSLASLPENLASNMGRMHRQHSQRNDEEQGTFHSEDLGMTVANMTADQAATFKGFEGVVIQKLDDDSPAARKGLQPGMLIRKVGQTPVKNVSDFEAALKHESVKSGVMLEVRSGEGNHFVVIKKS